MLLMLICTNLCNQKINLRQEQWGVEEEIDLGF